MSTVEVSPAIAGPSAATEKGDQHELPPPRSPSPEAVKCAICLEDLKNKSYSDSCCHQFCFACLLEWSKVKPECPLCKTSFRSIIHNIRGNADYDEYVVPANIPHLSIRLTSTDRYSPDIMLIDRQRRINALHDVVHAHANLDRYSLTRAFSSDHQDPRNRIIRYLEVSERGNNFAYASYRMARESNPFQISEQDYFNSSVDLTTDRYSGGESIPGYQSRRRIYDRHQYVLPFHSNLQPGTVFFPSVDYFRTHPAAMARVTPWLHRELLVLLGLNNTRQQLADVYEIIINLLQNYDIRSKEFRTMTKIYFGNKIKHFQHEFYHFLLSGMRMTEYDIAATYSLSPSASGNSVATAPPPIVTLDSDNEDNQNQNQNQQVDIESDDDDEVVVLSSGTSHNPPAPPLEPSYTRRIPSESRRFAEAYGSITPVTPIPVSSVSTVLSNFFECNPASTSSMTRRERPTEQWMPWLPPPPKNTDPRRGNSDGLPEFPSGRPPFQFSFESPWSAFADSDMGRAPLNTIIPPSPSSPNVSPWSENATDGTGIVDSMPQTSGGRRSRDRGDRRRRSRGGEAEPSRSSKRQKNSEEAESRSRQEKERSSSYRIRLRSSGRTTTTQGESSNSLALVGGESSFSPPDCSVTELSTGDNYTYNSRPLSGSGIGVHIRIIGRNKDSSSAGGSAAQSDEDSPTVTTPTRSALDFFKTQKVPTDNEVQLMGESDEDCVLLGVHPIVKKPPLAVITISSDDEEEENRKRMKAEQKDRPTTEPCEQDAFLAMFNSIDPTFDESILDYSLTNFESLDTSSVENQDKRGGDHSVNQKFFESLAAEARAIQFSYFPPSTSGSQRQSSKSGSSSHPYLCGNATNLTRTSSVITKPTSSSAYSPYSSHHSPESPPAYTPTSPCYTPASPPTYYHPDTNIRPNSSTNYQLPPEIGNSSSIPDNSESSSRFRAGMKRASYHIRPYSNNDRNQPSTSAAAYDKDKASSSTKTKISSSSTKSTGKSKNNEETKDNSRRISHRKKSKHKKSKKSVSHKKKSKKSKRERHSSSYSLSSSSSWESDFICDDSEISWIDDEDSDFETPRKKIKTPKITKNTRERSRKSKEPNSKPKKSSTKPKDKKTERKGKKKIRILESSSSSFEEDCPLMERLRVKHAKSKKRKLSKRIIDTDSSSESETEKRGKSQGETSGSLNTTATSSHSELSSRTNFGADLCAQLPYDLSLDNTSHSTAKADYTVKPVKHRWESDGSVDGGDDPFILTASTLGMHHVTSSSQIECHISDSSKSSLDGPAELSSNRDFLNAHLTESDMTAPDFSESYERRFSPTILERQTPQAEVMLNGNGSVSGDTSEDETGLLNLPYQSVEQMAAVLLARTYAATRGNGVDPVAGRNDSNSDLMLEINDDEQAGLAGLDLSLGRYDVDNEGTPNTATSSSYSQRWWSQPNQDWDD